MIMIMINVRQSVCHTGAHCVKPVHLSVTFLIKSSPVVLHRVQNKGPLIIFTARRVCIARICYGNVAGWLAGWLPVTASIVSKRLNLS